ncbi:MAG: DUF6690 family protein [Planctomycetota bacterium]
MQRPIAGVALLAAAVGGPYLAYETDLAGSLLQSSSVNEEAGDENIPGGYMTATGSQVSEDGLPIVKDFDYGSLPGSESASSNLSFIPIRALSEVVRFDISPSWIPQRFPRVSTVLAETQLDGVRVPLVTGTNATDLAGSLTYYFDRYKRVQRITIHAVTGEPSRFVAELQHAYQMQQQPVLGGELYLKKWNGRPTSLVYTSASSVITADQPLNRYQFFAEINQAGLEYGISSEAQTLLASGPSNRRW